VTREEASFQHRQRPCPHQRSHLAVLCGLTQILLASKAMASAAWISGLYLSTRYQQRRPSLRGYGGLRPLSERQMWPLVGFDGQLWWALMVSPCIARIVQACYKGIRPAIISDSDLG
jgi:hypothetical protein